MSLPAHHLLRTGAALLEWFDDGHPSISAEALIAWSGCTPAVLVIAGFIKLVPRAELPPGVPGDFYRLAPGFRERWRLLHEGQRHDTAGAT